jgi:DNA-binding winged helix-turn-helix (wHTH) protein
VGNTQGIVTFHFEEFSLDVHSRLVTAGHRTIPLTPKAFDLLVLLLEAHPRVVSKAELHERLWPGTYVSESSLANLINGLRATLGDDPKRPRMIRTAHRVGYAFGGPVTREDAPTRPSPAVRVTYWLTLPNRQFALTDTETVIGRDPEADISLQFPGISRRHARIVIARDHVTVEDLGSKNGTWLRGQRIGMPTALSDGDELTIGTVVLTFRAPTAGPSSITETVHSKSNL